MICTWDIRLLEPESGQPCGPVAYFYQALAQTDILTESPLALDDVIGWRPNFTRRISYRNWPIANCEKYVGRWKVAAGSPVRGTMLRCYARHAALATHAAQAAASRLSILILILIPRNNVTFSQLRECSTGNNENASHRRMFKQDRDPTYPQLGLC